MVKLSHIKKQKALEWQIHGGVSYKIGKSKAATKAIYKKLVYKYAKVRPSDQEVDQILIFEK